jgi:hypothetical protein
MEWQMSSIIIGALLFVSGYTLGRVSKTLEVARESRARWTPDPKISDADIEAAIRAKNTIQAIKLYRRSRRSHSESTCAVEAGVRRPRVAGRRSPSGSTIVRIGHGDIRDRILRRLIDRFACIHR